MYEVIILHVNMSVNLRETALYLKQWLLDLEETVVVKLYRLLEAMLCCYTTELSYGFAAFSSPLAVMPPTTMYSVHKLYI